MINTRYTGTHYFTVKVDDGVRLTINDQLIIDQWIQISIHEVRGSIYLVCLQFLFIAPHLPLPLPPLIILVIDFFFPFKSTGKLYPITIEFKDLEGSAVIVLYWYVYPSILYSASACLHYFLPYLQGNFLPAIHRGTHLSTFHSQHNHASSRTDWLWSYLR